MLAFIPALDAQCRMPNASDATFCASLHAQLAAAFPTVFQAPRFVGRQQAPPPPPPPPGPPRTAADHFVIRHFAGEVCKTLRRPYPLSSRQLLIHSLRSIASTCLRSLSFTAILPAPVIHR